MRVELLNARLLPIVSGDGTRQEVLLESEVALVNACTALRRVIRRAFQTAQPNIIGRPLLELIKRRETGAESNEKPFYSN